MTNLSPGAAPLVAGWHDPKAWSTDSVAPHQQFQRWREFVLDAHMHWAIPSVRCDRFPAYIRQGRFQGYRMTHLTSRKGGIVGTRGSREIACDDEAFFNLIYIAEGSIELGIGDDPTVLTPGTFTLWDTTRRMRFVTGDNLRQITLVMPQSELRRALPRADDYVGRKIEAGDSDVSRLFVDHLLSLDHTFGTLPRASAAHILNGAVELLAATLGTKVPLDDAGPGSVLLRQVMDFVVRHLDEPHLTTQRIAEAHHISARHLHRIFEAAGTSPATWVRRQRLERCRSELADPRGLSITQIAYRWGFGDAGSFSKLFRKEFGMCPRESRAAQGVAGEA